MESAKCKNCGNDFQARKADINRGWGIFCCKGCATQYRDKGELNPNWKNGISTNRYHYKIIEKLRYPERIKVRDNLVHAVKSGKLKRGLCVICGSENAQAHHKDYLKPYDVQWLCAIHHRELHIKLSAGVAQHGRAVVS